MTSFERALFFVSFLFVGSEGLAEAEWIWDEDVREAGSEVSLTRAFELPGRVVSARLRAVADFASLDLRLNGEPLARTPAYGSLLDEDVSVYLTKGKNRISLAACSEAKAPAVALRLDWVLAGERRGALFTDGEWRATTGKSGSETSRPVASYGSLVLEPWWALPPLTLDSLDDYTQWKRASNADEGTDPVTFFTLPGYEVERLRSAVSDEGSWVSLAFDPLGRLTIGREDKGLLRFTFSKPGGEIVLAESIENSLRECRGLLYAHDALYANANNSKALYRLRDLNGDDRFEEKELEILYKSEGGVGHGRNDLALGPEGKVYAIHGDSVRIPEDLPNRTSPLRRKLIPYRPNEGHVVRLDGDGKAIEIFCGGLRNPYGIAFNQDGEAFTYDADAENDMGTPWYRPTLVRHLTSGADFGWRAVTGSWPPFYPDHPENPGPGIHIGKGSPTSVKFGYGSRFSSKYKEALYVLDWTYGRILAVHLLERGAGYLGVPEVFLRGRPLNVTDLGFGPDGAMYFVTGGRRTQSALYRVRYVGAAPKVLVPTPQQAARKKLSRIGREKRRKLEAFHGESDFQGVVKEALARLGSADPRIRYAARVALEHRPAREWRGTVLRGDFAEPSAFLSGLTALVRAEPERASEVLARLAELDLDALPEELFLRLVQLCTVCLSHDDDKPPAKFLTQLVARYPNRSDAVNRTLAPLLLRLAPETSLRTTLRLLETCRDPLLTVHYLYHARNVEAGWTPALREAYFRKLGEANGYVGDSRGLPTSLGRIRRDALASLGPAEKKKYEALALRKESPLPMPDLAGRKFVSNWTLGDFDDELSGKKPEPDESQLRQGKKMFAVALCNRCHAFQGEGRAHGPDLTGVAGRFGRRDLLQAILAPSESIAQNYRTDLLELTDGRTLAGRIIPTLDYRAPYLLLAENTLFLDRTKKIPKAEVLARKPSQNSIMPPALLNNLTKQEVLALLAYLESAGK